MTIQQTLKETISESWRSKYFLDSLQKNPEKAIKEKFGVHLRLPENKTLIVNDQTNPKKYYLNLPIKPELEELDLTDEQLDIISGGEIGFSIAAGVVAAVSLGLIGVAVGGAIANSMHGDPSYNCN